jgi:hypothetical protein
MRPSGSRGDRAVIWLRCGSFFIGLGGKIVHITDAPNSDVHFSEMQAAIGGLRRFENELNFKIPARQNRRLRVDFSRGVVA